MDTNGLNAADRGAKMWRRRLGGGILVVLMGFVWLDMAGCGQKGGLYLPPLPEKQKEEPSKKPKAEMTIQHHPAMVATIGLFAAEYVRR